MSLWKLMNARWGSGAGETDEIRMDGSTNALNFISYEHHEIHSGSHYFHKESYDLPKNGTIDHLIVTPATPEYAHMIIGVENTISQVLVSLYEDTTTSADGAVDTIFNRNRNVADDNTTEIYTTPTVTGVGTMLWSITLGASKALPGGTARDDQELVLDGGSKYMLRIVEPNVAATTVNVSFDWYEHTDKH